MRYVDEETCKRFCLSTCDGQQRRYRCRYNFTYAQIVIYIIYFLLICAMALSMFLVYNKYKKKNGFTKERMGPCCYKYVPMINAQEMRQVVYLEDPEGNLTQVDQNFVLVPTNRQNSRQLRDVESQKVIIPQF